MMSSRGKSSAIGADLFISPSPAVIESIGDSRTDAADTARAAIAIRTPLSSLQWAETAFNSIRSESGGNSGDDNESDSWGWWTPSPAPASRDPSINTSFARRTPSSGNMDDPGCDDNGATMTITQAVSISLDVGDWDAPTLPFLPEIEDFEDECIGATRDEHGLLGGFVGANSTPRGRLHAYLPRPCFSPDILTLPFIPLAPSIQPRSRDREDDEVERFDFRNEFDVEEIEYQAFCHGHSSPPPILLPLMATPDLADRNAIGCYFPVATLSMRRQATKAFEQRESLA